MKRRRFLPWIFLFLFLLGAIPVLVILNQLVWAKILGFVTILLVTIALAVWREQTRRSIQKAPRIKLNLNDRFWLNDKIPFYRNLKKKERKTFEDRLGVFLSEKVVVQVGQEVPDKDLCLYVGASAVQSFWGFPHWAYSSFDEIVVYPENYNEEMEFAKTGFVSDQLTHGTILDRVLHLSVRHLKGEQEKLSAYTESGLSFEEYLNLAKELSEEETHAIPTHFVWMKSLCKDLENRAKGEKPVSIAVDHAQRGFLTFAKEFFKNTNGESRNNELSLVLKKHYGY